jgi:hypothetical protein
MSSSRIETVLIAAASFALPATKVAQADLQGICQAEGEANLDLEQALRFPIDPMRWPNGRTISSAARPSIPLGDPVRKCDCQAFRASPLSPMPPQIRGAWLDSAGDYNGDALHVVERYARTAPDPSK